MLHLLFLTDSPITSTKFSSMISTIAHLEPTADSVDVSGDADSIKAALADL